MYPFSQTPTDESVGGLIAPRLITRSPILQTARRKSARPTLPLVVQAREVVTHKVLERPDHRLDSLLADITRALMQRTHRNRLGPCHASARLRSPPWCNPDNTVVATRQRPTEQVVCPQAGQILWEERWYYGLLPEPIHTPTRLRSQLWCAAPLCPAAAAVHCSTTLHPNAANPIRPSLWCICSSGYCTSSVPAAVGLAALAADYARYGLNVLKSLTRKRTCPYKGSLPTPEPCPTTQQQPYGGGGGGRGGYQDGQHHQGNVPGLKLGLSVSHSFFLYYSSVPLILGLLCRLMFITVVYTVGNS